MGTAGNPTSDEPGIGTHTFQWDAEGRMISVDSSGSCSTATACYTYNALGQRVEKQTGATYDEYVYDPTGVEAGASAPGTYFAWQYLVLGERRFGKYASNATYFIHADNLGTTATGTDYSGALAWHMLSYPWGQTWSTVGTVSDTRFASLHSRDSESNLDKTHFRMFSSDQGRWFSPDPKAGCGGNPQKHNRYAYVRNSPANLTDPHGLDYSCCNSDFGCLPVCQSSFSASGGAGYCCCNGNPVPYSEADNCFNTGGGGGSTGGGGGGGGLGFSGNITLNETCLSTNIRPTNGFCLYTCTPTNAPPGTVGIGTHDWSLLTIEKTCGTWVACPPVMQVTVKDFCIGAWGISICYTYSKTILG